MPLLSLALSTSGDIFWFSEIKKGVVGVYSPSLFFLFCRNVTDINPISKNSLNRFMPSTDSYTFSTKIVKSTQGSIFRSTLAEQQALWHNLQITKSLARDYPL